MENLIEAKNMVRTFAPKTGLFSIFRGWGPEQIHAVNNVSLSIRKGSIHGLVGESGSGKTTLGRLILLLIKPTSGEVWFEGRQIYPSRSKLSRADRREMQMIYQDPYTSVDPMQKVRSILEEPLIIHRENKGTRMKRVSDALESVDLVPPEDYLDKQPYELSGGQRQRVAFARALILRPSFIVADEPVSNLDILIRKPILAKFLELRERFEFTSLFITHDIGVARYISDYISVMYRGEIVESASPGEIISSSLHPYTQQLIEAVPKKARTRGITQSPILPTLVQSSSGCFFADRCNFRKDECLREKPSLREIRPGHFVSCHFAEQFT
jgi:peptide/nickel transport system ATP-binding protein